MESELFESYYAEFSTLSVSIRTKIQSLMAIDKGTDKYSQTIRAVEREENELHEILSQMDNEVHSMNPTARGKRVGVLAECKKISQDVKQEFKKQKESRQREELMEYGSQTKLMEASNQLQKTGDSLHLAHKTALESERSGIETLQVLRQQREQLERTRGTIREVDGTLDQAQRTLRQMGRRLASGKWLTYGIIAVLILLIFMVIYFKFT